VLFGNGLAKKESLLIFDKEAMQDLFDLLATLLKSEKTHVDGANLLLEVWTSVLAWRVRMLQILRQPEGCAIVLTVCCAQFLSFITAFVFCILIDAMAWSEGWQADRVHANLKIRC